MQHFLLNSEIYMEFFVDNGESKYTCVLYEYGIMMCIWSHVLLHQMDKMLNNQKSNLVHNG